LPPRLFDAVIVPQRLMEEVAGQTRPGAEIAHLPWAHVKTDPAGRTRLSGNATGWDEEAEVISYIDTARLLFIYDKI
jgi:hypothetical protein